MEKQTQNYLLSLFASYSDGIWVNAFLEWTLGTFFVEYYIRSFYTV